jgi:nucleotide-binding universal stress UspA family protein
MVQRILVGTDGSEDSGHAVEWCAEFARDSGIEVVVCHVVSTFSEWMMSAAQINFDKLEEEHRRLLFGPWTEPLRAAGVAYDIVQTKGDAVKALLEVAEEEDVDMIVIGKAGHSTAGELLLGGTAAKLAHRTVRPLLVVPARRPEHGPRRRPVVDERHVPLPG